MIRGKEFILNARKYIETFLMIQTKDGRLERFHLNEPQDRLYQILHEEWGKGKPIRVIILKARQMGFSTLTEGLIFWSTATQFDVNSMIVAHTDEATANLFRMSKRFYDLLPEAIKPMSRSSNAQEIVFDAPAKLAAKGARGLRSRLRCATAGGSGVGRSYTLRNVHMSEFAFWPGAKMETFTGIMSAVPDSPGTIVIIESTANGYDEFKKLWDRAVQARRDGTDGFLPVFFPWFEMKDYRRPPLPNFQRTAEEQELADTFRLDDEQLAWRRWCIENMCGGDVNLFHQEFPATPDEAFIATGRCAFDKQALVLRREQVRKDTWERGMFRYSKGADGKILSWEWHPEEQGPLRIRKHPEKGVPYVLGGDTAGTGSDFFAGHVVDNRTGEQVAVLHHQFGERMFAEQVYCLGMYYNTALVGIETNYSTYPEMVLEELGYPNLYVRQRLDNYTGKLMDTFGFDTNTATRPAIIDGLKDVAKSALELITDYDTLGEMLTFVYDQNWKAQAEQGEHDDLVMSLAITHFIRGQQTTQVRGKEKAAGAHWTNDMWEDYNRATPEERDMLIRMWGEPAR